MVYTIHHIPEPKRIQMYIIDIILNTPVIQYEILLL